MFSRGSRARTDAVLARCPDRKVQTTLGSRNEPPLQAMPVVASGDSLWKVAERYYKQGKKWTVIYAANQKMIGVNPDRIQPGHKLMIPKLGAD